MKLLNPKSTISASVNRRTILKGLAALGAAGSDLATFAEALAQSSSDDVAQLTMLIQGGPVAETINNVALPISKRQYPGVSVQLEVSANAVAYPKMLAQRSVLRAGIDRQDVGEDKSGMDAQFTTRSDGSSPSRGRRDHVPTNSVWDNVQSRSC